MDGLQKLYRTVFGSRPENYARVRLGRGVVGNTTYGLYAVSAAIVGITFALRADPPSALIADGGVLAIYAVYLFGTYIFAHLHPETAALGDTEWLKWHQSQIAAKDVASIPPALTPPTLDPHSSLKMINHQAEAKDAS
jgi:hypothetical protein